MNRNTRAHSIEATDAEAALDRLLDRVEQGDSIIITRNGAPVARLVPYGEPIDASLVDKAIREVEKLRKGITLRGITVRELIDDGRRI
jgi:prevent-host-death family protein